MICPQAQQRIATVFGGTGFLGHAVIQELAAKGYIIRVPTRSSDKAQDLKMLGKVGQIFPFHTTTFSDKALNALIQDCDVVVNLIGIFTEKKASTFQSLHVKLPARLARLAYGASVVHFVHVSTLGADIASPSHYAKSKALGEEAVRAFFPNAVILRPSLIFGPRDRFFNKLAVLARFFPFLPLISEGKAKFQPLYVGTVAQAVAASLEQKKARGRTFELGGPKIYSLKEMIQLLLKIRGRRRPLIFMPNWLLRLQTSLFKLFPKPPLTQDQVRFLQKDNIVNQSATSNREGTLQDLGISATALEKILPTYISKLKAP